MTTWEKWERDALAAGASDPAALADFLMRNAVIRARELESERREYERCRDIKYVDNIIEAAALAGKLAGMVDGLRAEVAALRERVRELGG